MGEPEFTFKGVIMKKGIIEEKQEAESKKEPQMGSLLYSQKGFEIWQSGICITALPFPRVKGADTVKVVLISCCVIGHFFCNARKI